MTWSYSRITAFEDCPYKWFLKYIKRLPPLPLFFSSYGSFLHKIIERFLTGELSKRDLPGYYLQYFREQVTGRAPSQKVFDNYFSQGLRYLKTIHFPYAAILEVERKVEFEISGIPFIGFVDLVANEDGLILVDNKSRILKPRSGRMNPTQSDRLLNQYLRQLYLYSIPISRQYGAVPVRLDFNCFRSNRFIEENFDENAYAITQSWALERIAQITEETGWRPSLDYFKCSFLCDMSPHCEYVVLFQRGGDA